MIPCPEGQGAAICDLIRCAYSEPDLVLEAKQTLVGRLAVDSQSTPLSDVEP